MQIDGRVTQGRSQHSTVFDRVALVLCVPLQISHTQPVNQQQHLVGRRRYWRQVLPAQHFVLVT